MTSKDIVEHEFRLSLLDLVTKDRHCDGTLLAKTTEPTLEELVRYKKNIDSAIRIIEGDETLYKVSAEELKHSVSITDVVEYELPETKRSGDKIYSVCPFHEETVGSFRADDERGTFLCYGCKAQGDIFKFIMLLKKMTFSQSIKYIQETYE